MARDGAGLHIHDDGRAAVGRPGLPDGDLEVFLGDALDGLVNGENQAVARLRFDGAFIPQFVRHGVAPAVFGRHHPAGLAGELAVVFSLQPFQAVIVGSGKTEHAGEDAAKRIFPLVILDDPEYSR